MAMELMDPQRNCAGGGDLPVLGSHARRGFSCTSRKTDEFDPVIWSRMPESVLFLVFSKLPLKSLMRVRSVSKLWRSADFFSDGWQGRDASRFALAKCGNRASVEEQELWLFDTPAHEWCKLRLSLPVRFRGPFAAAGGLLCYISSSSSRGPLEVVVGNPVTRIWRSLRRPLALCEFPTLTLMSMDANAGGRYAITLVGLCDNDGALVIETYDSTSDSWSCTDSPPELTSYYNFFKGDEFQGLAAIDRRSKAIKGLAYPATLRESSFLDRYEDKCWILESRGNLFMCSNAPRKEGLWQQRLGSEWSQVCSFPKVLKKYEETAMFLSDDVVLLVGSEPHRYNPQFEDIDPHTMVVFDKLTQQWSELPNVPACFGNVDGLVGGFMFEPRFGTKP